MFPLGRKLKKLASDTRAAVEQSVILTGSVLAVSLPHTHTQIPQADLVACIAMSHTYIKLQLIHDTNILIRGQGANSSTQEP